MVSKIVKHPSIVYAEDIKSICQPLQKLKINYFAHVHIDKSKQFSAIANHPRYAEHYLKNKCYNMDIHMADTSILGKYIIWDAIEFSGKSAVEHQTAIQFGIDHVFTIIEADPSGTHYFHFGSNLLDKSINQIYISQIELLKLFVCYFKEKIISNRVLHAAYDLKFSIDDEVNAFEIKTDACQLNQLQMKSDFLNDMQLIKKRKLLSAREIEILTWLHHGKTVNEIANILQLADITVNKHIANIKEKAQCYTQFQLGEFFNQSIL